MPMKLDTFLHLQARRRLMKTQACLTVYQNTRTQLCIWDFFFPNVEIKSEDQLKASQKTIFQNEQKRADTKEQIKKITNVN